MTVGSFTDKQLRVKLIMAGTNSVFPNTNSNTLTLTNLRMSARVQTVARQSTNADISIWGMKRADMNALTVAWANPPIIRNHVVILDVNSGDGWTQLFSGTILEAQPVYDAAPNVPFRVQAITGYFQKINPAPPTSYPGSVPILQIVTDLAARMGFTVADGGAKGVLTQPYLSGTLYDQLQQACQAAGADFYLQGDVILVTPRGIPRAAAPSVILSPSTGLIGYPSYERAGLSLACLYRPAILCGSPIEVRDSVVYGANGRWFPYAAEHQLESRQPNGAWFSKLFCMRVAGEVVPP